jgi:hypothetical protein
MNCTDRRLAGLFVLVITLWGQLGPAMPGFGAETATIAAGFDAARPLLARYCLECHSGDRVEGEIDLSLIHEAAGSDDVKRMQRMAEMLATAQMPPPESDQPTDAERQFLEDWLKAFLTAEARAHAGDPGRIVLRRLNNAEYTHTIRDLTGVDSLDPAREFPVDGGAGEGFTNTGQSLVMSPSLVTKYLDAAKGIAAHAVLLPDGLRFATGDTRRDFADEAIARLKAFYARFTRPLGAEVRAAQTTVKQGIALDMGGDGFLPVEPYLLATLDLRARQRVDSAAVDAAAREHGLSTKYLRTLWQVLSGPDTGSLLIDRIRGEWRLATTATIDALAADIGRWQDAVWRFNAVGQIGRHLGREDGPASWLAVASPLVREQEFRIKLPAAAEDDPTATVTVHFAAGDAGDGNADDIVLFKAARLVAAGRTDLPLRRVPQYGAAVDHWRPQIAATAEACLAAAGEALAAAANGPEQIGPLAVRHGVDRRFLQGWLSLLGVGSETSALDALFAEKVEAVGGWDFISGWRGERDLWVFANASDQEVQIPQRMRPHGIAVHPVPKRRAVVGWRSPIRGEVRLEGGIQRAHAVCGNGVAWELQVRRGKTRQVLMQAVADTSARRLFAGLDAITVREGDMICLTVGARDGNHQCDSTAIDLTITAGGDSADQSRVWDLGKDCASDLLAANPHADSQGRPDIWHFGSEPDTAGSGPTIPQNSTLARWLAASAADRPGLARELADRLKRPVIDPADGSPDAVLARMLTAAAGPLLGHLLDAAMRGEASSPDLSAGLLSTPFGRPPEQHADVRVEPDDLCFRAPHVLTIEIPRPLADGCELVTTALVPAGSGPAASVQPWVGIGTGPSVEFSAAAAIVAAEPSPAWNRQARSLREFRELFPKAVCYARIVPVDEVVTLNLLYREDDHLRRLLLDEAESAHLDRLWDELLFIAQEPLELQNAFEQLRGYASQDRPDLVTTFKPMIPVIAGRAEAFKQRLVDVEPRQFAAVVELAGRAYRRPLRPEEEGRLWSLYTRLRQQNLPHEEAIRMLIAHLLVAPEFLYKLEVPGNGTTPGPVSDHELATRLSYFLWSSMPDGELRAAADAGRLHDFDVLLGQTRRMLASPASRRLAEEFGMQWLHVYGFAGHDEKNAEAFPTFSGLRADMEEETVRFLDDFFRHDRSILSLIDANHTFLNERLAKHYGIEGVTGDAWRRVDDVRKHGRGSILGLATTLSTQAGASRTSPILRGNWLYEAILGEKLPKPPKDVPLLAETVPAGFSERQLIAMHSENAACAKCHRHIDPFGFALEEFDAIGRVRTADAAGRPIDATATVLDGTVIDGQPGLRGYLLGPRRDQFVRVFCRKLLGYALGRGVQLSDEPFLDDMVAGLAAQDYRVSVAIEAIVTSSQFRTIRGRDAAETQRD